MNAPRISPAASVGGETFEAVVMRDLRVADVLKPVLLLAKEPATFRALTVQASPRWNALLRLAQFPSAPAGCVSLGAYRMAKLAAMEAQKR